MNNTAMFVIGFIIFAAYMWGYLSMISKANKEQKEKGQQLFYINAPFDDT